MNNWIKYLMLFALLIGGRTAYAQSEFTASVDKNPVAVGDRFKLTLTIKNAKGNITPPNLSDFNLIFGPAKSTNYQFINGESSSTISFTYTLTPKATGTYTIGSAVAKTDKGDFKSEPIQLKVVEGQSSSAAQSGRSGSAGSGRRTAQGNDDLMAEIRLDKKQVYKGEQVVVTYYVYSRYRNIDFVDYDFPATNGFYSQEFDEEQAGWQNQLEVINGKQYRVAILKRQILFPQQHGKLEIDPMEIKARVDYSFFNAGRTISVKSNPVKLDVLPLPPAPAGFKGDVGSFNFQVKVDRNKIAANDAITLTATISGSGNLKLVNAPDFKFPPDFEVYDPKVSDRFSTTGGGLRGSREFEYLIIPRHSGQYTIESFAFTYFNTGSKSYKTIQSDPIELEVERAAGDPAGRGYTGSSKEDVVILDQDIRYIKPAEPLRQRSGYFFQTTPFYGLLSMGPVFVLLFFVVRRKYIQQQQDVASVRSRRAGRIARKLLSNAKKKLRANEREGFYDAVSKAMFGYLSGKLNIDAAELSREQIKSRLKDRSVDSTTIDELMGLLSRCEMARFARTGELNPESDYNSAAKIIGELQKKL